jgi:LuxR family transcriptional regulator, maltose regulon positive regulatory protein
MVDSTRDKAISSPLLETKLFIPRPRAGLVARVRLIERLNQASAGKLTLVSAPAGFGKTTLLAEWLATAEAGKQPAAWLALDQSDNDPALFWSYVIAALQTRQRDLGLSALALLQSLQPLPVETLLAKLLNEVGALAQRIVLVLDDYHLITAKPVHQGIAFVLDHLPPQLHLVIAGRADPPLPLSRLRARGELTELRAANLRFSADEASAFLNEVMGLHLRAQDVAALEARTEGWVAGLQLAALSMQGRDDVSSFISAFTGDDRYIIDYLVEEVLQRQSEDVRSFLLQTSILDRLSGPLCNAVTGRETGQAMLETLERANLFIVPLDDKRRWYRYHQLFADVLQARAMEEQPDRVLALHGHASEWLARNGQPTEAIHHALAAGDFERVASLVELVARATIRKSNQSARLLEWLRLVPDDLIRVRPVLSTYYAFALLGMGEMDAAAVRLSEAERWLDESRSEPPSGAGASRSEPASGVDESVATRDRPGASPVTMVVADKAEFRSLPGTIALARSFRAQALGDVAGTLEQARRALNLLPEDDHVWRGGAALLLALAHWTSGDLEAAQQTHAVGIASLDKAGDIALAISAAYDAADLARARGLLSAAGRIYRQALQLAPEHGDPALPGIADLHLGLSDLCCERNDLEAATRHLQQSEQPGKHADLRETPYRRCIAWARLRLAQRDLEGAIDLLDQAERLHVPGVVPDIHPIAAQKARLWIAQGRVSEAVDWVRQQGLSADDDLTYMGEFGHITLARILLAQGDDRSIDKVRRLLERLLDAADQGGRTGRVIEILVLQALVQRLLGDIPAGLVPLERALTLAEAEGYVRIFVDEGEPMRDLLRHAVAQGISGAYARRLLAAFDNGAPHPVSAPAGPSVADLAEPLTAREVEILRLIAAGMRNQEIADELVISLSTVKRHIANTYGKLGVSHRTEAVARLTS